MPAKGKRSALAQLAGHLGELIGINPGVVLASLLEPERLGSTGMGHGVAVPHTGLQALEGPAAMLAILQHPVDSIARPGPGRPPAGLPVAAVGHGWLPHNPCQILPASAHPRTARTPARERRPRGGICLARAFQRPLASCRAYP